MVVREKDLEKLKKILLKKGIKLSWDEIVDISTSLINLVKNLYITKCKILLLSYI